MTELQKSLLKLLYEIDQICLKNNIEYYVFAGSMLGIERNEGFLPWDDDLDIVMTKSNYERFLQITKNIPYEDRIFECVERNEGFPLHFGKYMNTATSHIVRSLAFGNSSAGVWIDVMYVVPLPKAEKKINRIKKWFPVFCELENESHIEYSNREKGFYWRYRLGLFLIALLGKRRALKTIHTLFDKNSEEQCESFFLHHSLDANFRMYEKKFFGPPERKLYGGLEVSVSPYNREFSRAAYGDSWMMVPEHDNQISHVVVCDLTRSYKKYVDDYMTFLDGKLVNNELKETKKRHAELFFRRNPKLVAYLESKAVIVACEARHAICKKDIDLKQLILDQQYEEIGELYSDYLSVQLSLLFMRYQVFVPLSDELLYPILAKLICYDGQYYIADKILALRTKSGKHGDTTILDSLKKTVDVCRKLSIALWDHHYDMQEVEQILEAAKQYTDLLPCRDMQVAEAYLMKGKVESSDRIQTKCWNVLQAFPEAGECYKILGDIEKARDHKEQAKTYYAKAENKTANGLVLLEIEKCRKELSF